MALPRRLDARTGSRAWWSTAIIGAVNSASRRRTFELPEFLAVPADGVYAGWLGGMPAAVSIGTNPTFNGIGRRVEAYVSTGSISISTASC